MSKMTTEVIMLGSQYLITCDETAEKVGDLLKAEKPKKVMTMKIAAAGNFVLSERYETLKPEEVFDGARGLPDCLDFEIGSKEFWEMLNGESKSFFLVGVDVDCNYIELIYKMRIGPKDYAVGRIMILSDYLPSYLLLEIRDRDDSKNVVRAECGRDRRGATLIRYPE